MHLLFLAAAGRYRVAMGSPSRAYLLMALALHAFGCRRERSETAPADDDGKACSNGVKQACLRRIAELDLELVRLREPAPSARSRDRFAERDRLAERLCELRDCLPRYRFTLGDGSGTAQETWRRPCKENRKLLLAAEEVSEPAGATDSGLLDPTLAAHRSCELLATLATSASTLRERCLAGSAADCIGWSDVVVAEDPARAVHVVLPEEYRRRGLQRILPLADFIELGLDRGRQHGNTWITRLHQLARARVALGRDPRPGECWPGFGGCLGRTQEQVEAEYRRARVRVVRAEPSDEAKLPATSLRAAIETARKTLLECHGKALLANPNVQGEVTVHARIDATGHAWNVSRKASDVPDVSVVSCVLDVVSRWHFAPSAAGSSVTVALAFEPVDR